MFKHLWKILLVIFIIVCIFFPVLAPLMAEYLCTVGSTMYVWLTSAAVTGLSMWLTGAVGIGLAYLIDPETTTEVVSDLADAATTVASAVVGVAAAAVTAATSSLSSLFYWALAGLGIYWFATKDDKQKVIDSGDDGVDGAAVGGSA